MLRNDGAISFLDATARLTDIDAYLRAARSQDEIGFENFVFGRISRSWMVCQDIFLLHNAPKRHTLASTWAKRVVYQLYVRMNSIWKKRRQLIHGADGKAVSKREKRRSVRKLSFNFDWDRMASELTIKIYCTAKNLLFSRIS